MQHNQHIVDLAAVFSGHGISHVVICPGSRNAPLIQAFTGNTAFICHSIVDERSAAYVALGMARETGKPVAVVTTSGTAVLNLLPAVAEAYYQKVPLVLVTADRPLEKISEFNNQWIDQEAPFYNYTKGFLQLPGEVFHPEDLEQEMARISEVLSEAVRTPAGPVHINALLTEPLYEKLPGEAMAGPGSRAPLAPEPEEDPSDGSFPGGPGERILVLAGMGSPSPEISGLLTELVKQRRAVVVAENISNLPGEGFIRYPELCMRVAGEDMKKNMEPDTVIGFGGQVVSKQLRIFLQSLEKTGYRHICCNPVPFLKTWLGQSSHSEDEGLDRFAGTWEKAEKLGAGRYFERLANLPFGNLLAVHKTLEAAPAGSVIHLGNSATIRYSQVVPVRNDLTYFSNRGTSGIDGCVSSAVGAAMVSDRMHILMAGDLSFVYDSNALWNKDYPSNLRIVVLNDAGGGIFRLLTGPSSMPFYEEFSVTRHPVSLELLAQSFGRGFMRTDSPENIDEALSGLLRKGSGATVLEVDTAGSENSSIFTGYLDL
jgi:2-succinyl-5-enolpyruvyl-6-hydroxy-3-cyclohexene-1-carboxylate synthase